MNKSFKLILIAVLFLVILGVAAVLYGDLSGQYSEDMLVMEETGELKAVNFTVLDNAGNETTLFENNVSGVVVNFWASWCQPCKSEMEHFEKMFKKYGDKIQFMMVNMTDGSRETIETASAYIKETGYTFPVFYDSYLSAANAYMVASIPATYFIDKSGNVVTYANGMINEKQLESGIAMLIQE